MKNIVLLLILAITVCGCGLANSEYLTKNFDLNNVLSANVGSTMIDVESGLKNDVYGWKVSGVKQELVYGGIENNVLNVAYREYQVNRNGAFIKDGFTQNLKYDISNNKIITFRSLKIEILEANSNEVKFKVIEWKK